MVNEWPFAKQLPEKLGGSRVNEEKQIPHPHFRVKVLGPLTVGKRGTWFGMTPGTAPGRSYGAARMVVW